MLGRCCDDGRCLGVKRSVLKFEFYVCKNNGFFQLLHIKLMNYSRN